MRRKRSKASQAGYITALILLTGCTIAVFLSAFCVAFGIYILSTEKMIALLIFMAYLCSRAGRK